MHPVTPFSLPCSRLAGRSSSGSLSEADEYEMRSVSSSSSSRSISPRGSLSSVAAAVAAGIPSTGTPELPPGLDPEWHEAVEGMDNWHRTTSHELQALPRRSPDASSNAIDSNDGTWTWLFGLSGSRSAGVLHPFTRKEQQALVGGHKQLRRRMRALQPFLINLSQLVGERALRLQQAGSALVHTLNDNARLFANIEVSNDINQEHQAKLTQAAADLEAAHTKVEELEGAVAQLRADVAAGVALAQEMEAENKGLECSSKEARAAHKRQMELLEENRTELQDKYTYAQGLRAELGNLKNLCTSQKRDLQSAAEQLEAVNQQAQAAVARVEQRGAAERQRLREEAAALQDHLSSVQLNFTETKAKLVRSGAEIDAMMMELEELEVAMQEAGTASSTLTAASCVTQEDLELKKKMLQQLQAEKSAKLQAEVKEAEELAVHKAQEEESRKQLGATAQEKVARLKEKLQRHGQVLVHKERNARQVCNLEPKITAANEGKAKANSQYNVVRKSLDTCKHKTEKIEASIEQRTTEIEASGAKIQAHHAKKPDYARAKEEHAGMMNVQRKLWGMMEKRVRQLNALQSNSSNERKAKEAQEEGVEQIKQLASKQQQLEEALAEQQQFIKSKQRDMDAASAALAQRFVDQDTLHASLMAKLRVNPRKKELLEQLDKEEGKVKEAKDKVEQRLKARKKMEKTLAAAHAQIAASDVAAKGADGAIQLHGKLVERQDACKTRAHAVKAIQEGGVEALKNQIRKLEEEASWTTQRRAGRWAAKTQLAQKVDTLRRQLGKQASDAGEVHVHAQAGAGGMSVANQVMGVGGGTQQGQGSSEQGPAASLGNELWPSLAGAASSSVKAPCGGR